MTSSNHEKPLEGLLVLDFCQFLSGPLATLRMADMGARVVKIERPGTGDLGRTLYLSDTDVHGENTLFHAINRNKESFAADLKNPRDLEMLRKLIMRSDVMVQNFRPGVIERLNLDYDSLSKINPRLVYGSVTGYGDAAAWRERPGQDLLAQARSGVMWLSGDEGGPPTPMALAIADMLAGHNLCEGILACLVRRGTTGRGGLVETSLLESLIDFQFEVLTTHMNDGRRPPRRSAYRNAHAYLAAPYGVYDTSNGYLALAMGHLPTLGKLLGIPELEAISDSAEGFRRRDELKRLIANRLREHTTEHWLGILDPADIWCSEVLDWPKLFASEGFKQLQMVQTLEDARGLQVLTTRLPIRIGHEILKSPKLAPKVGEHTEAIKEEFGLG
ncbi:MAG: CaiB/BaiF CoA-transferase family protein [Candidatus Acidiferrales bacterium]